MRPNERRAAQLLNDLLISQSHISTFCDGANPPDVEFIVDNNKWDVEITQLHQHIMIDESAVSRAGPENRMFYMFQKIKDKSKGIINGEYRLNLMGPFSQEEYETIFSRVIKHIKNGDLSYYDIFNDDRCILSGHESDNNNIECSIGINGTTRLPTGHLVANITESINYFIQKALEEKNIIFGGLGGSNKKVLLLDNHYFFSNYNNITDAVRENLPAPLYIDEIYLICDGRALAIWP